MRVGDDATAQALAAVGVDHDHRLAEPAGLGGNGAAAHFERADARHGHHFLARRHQRARPRAPPA